MPAVSPTRAPSAADLQGLLSALKGGASPAADDGGAVMSKSKDGSIAVPDLKLNSGPQATGRFSHDLALEHREDVPVIKQAIDGIAQLTGTKISTDIKTIGFHAGDIPISGVVKGAKDNVLAAMSALEAIKQQL